MEAAAQPPTRMGVEPPEQHKQLETIAGTNSGPNIQAAQESKEYQHTKNNLTMLETWQLGLLAATTHDWPIEVVEGIVAHPLTTT